MTQSLVGSEHENTDLTGESGMGILSSEAEVGEFPLRGATRDLLTLLPLTKTTKEAVQVLSRRLTERKLVSTRLLFEYVLDRLPDSGALATRPIEKLESSLLMLIESDEYRFHIARRVMQAFPEYRREFFLHIPKSGGTTASAAMEATGRYISLPSAQWLKDGNVPDFRGFLTNIARKIASKERTTFTIHGHLSAGQLIKAGIKRFDDHVFTVIRNPQETVYSHLNYILAKLESASGIEHCTADVKLWRNLLKVSVSFAPSKETNIDALVQVCLRRFIGRNTICTALGSDGTASSSLDNIFRLGIEIIDFTRLQEYLAHRGWNSALHENRSEKFAAIQVLSESIRSEIQEGISEDVKLYHELQDNWRQSRPRGPS